MLSLFLQFCLRTFVSSSFHPVLVPFREFLFAYGLFVHNNTSCNPLCRVLSPATPSGLLHTSRESPVPTSVHCVFSSSCSYYFGLFFCVSLCNPTPLHPHAPIHTHTHPHTTIYTPSTSLPRSHTFHPSPHPYLSRARPSAPIHVVSYLVSASLRAPMYHSTH